MNRAAHFVVTVAPMRCLMLLFVVASVSIGIARAESSVKPVLARSDRDCDGVADAQDACPRAPGSASTTPALHGCPQPGMVIVTGCPMPIVPMIHFTRGARLVGDVNHRVIAEVAQALREHIELDNIAVQGHASPDEPNPQQLGAARARAVVAALVAAGIAAERLTVESYGSQRPIVGNAARQGREQNRRVQFQRLEEKPGS